MNIKIARTMLILCAIYLVGFYVLKFAFPEQLLLTITGPKILYVGEFIESSIVYLNIYYFISTFVTFYLFVSASKGSFKAKWYELLYIAVADALYILVTDLLPDLSIHTSISLMFLLVLLCKGQLKYAVPTFIVHGYFSEFLFAIRGLEYFILEINIASGIVLSLEGYVWLVLFGLMFYLMERKNGKNITTISTQGSKGLQS